MTSNSVTTSTIATQDASTSQNLYGDSWEVYISNEWESKIPKIQIPGLELLLFNNSTHGVILLIKEKAAISIEEHALESLRGLRDVGAKLNAAKQVKINEMEFILLDSSRDEITAWTWVTVYNGFAYTFSCSGLSTLQTQEEVCQGIVNTLKIK
jgi:hypothetical protein